LSRRARRALFLSALLLLPAMLISGCGDRFREISRERQCRANMNTLATDQAVFRSTHSHWASTVGELDQAAGRTLTLLCPSNCEPYRITLVGSEYRIECPAVSHGSIQTGTPSWAAPVRRTST
jgi:hypothetical protein